jgi:hypothetical protein
MFHMPPALGFDEKELGFSSHCRMVPIDQKISYETDWRPLSHRRYVGGSLRRDGLFSAKFPICLKIMTVVPGRGSDPSVIARVVSKRP